MDITALTLVASLAAATSAKPAYEAGFADVPAYTVESDRLTATVRYRTPSTGDTVRLHCEMKSGTGAYLAGREKRVRGTGTVRFVFAVPTSAMAARVRLVVWMGERWDRSLCPLVRSPLIEIYSKHRANRLRRMKQDAPVLLKRIRRLNRTGARAVGVYQAGASKWPPSIATNLVRDLRAARMPAMMMPPSALANPFVLRRNVFAAIVLVDSGVLPAEAGRSLSGYLREGGALVSLGGPAFQTALWRHGTVWLTRDEYRRVVTAGLPVRIVRRFERGAGGEWERSSNNLTAKSRVIWTPDGAPADSGGAVRIEIRDLNGWDTFTMPPVERFPFSEKAAWTSFWAKGDRRTSELAVEWREKDGSRWIATTPITTDWRQYVLPPGAFRSWQNTAKGRGGPGDAFHPQNAETLIFGLAFTHTRTVGQGDHTVWLDAIGVAEAPGPDIDPEALRGEPLTAPTMEGISPPWKLYPVTNAAAFRPTPGQTWFDGLLPKLGKTLYSPYARPAGTGIHKSRPWRFQSVIEYRDRDGRFCGSAAAVLLHAPSTGKLPAAATVPVADPAFFNASPGRDLVVSLIRRLLDGVFLYEGGAAWYASFGKERIPIGAQVINRGRQTTAVEVLLRVTAPDATVAWERSRKLTVAPGAVLRVEDAWDAPAPGGRGAKYSVTCELRSGGRTIDRLEHQLRLVAPPARPAYVVRTNGGFRLNERPWFVHGVNYMPSSGIALDLTDNFEFWLDPAPYDPEIIQRDLDDIKRIGFNSVSVFQYYRSMRSRNLLDLLERCREHGLKVNLSLRPGTPLDFHWAEVREMITTARLAGNDTVFAYDLAWEPSWGNHDRRKRWDREWEKWIIDRYGSFDAAEKTWGNPVPRDGQGRVTNPSDKEVAHDGPWRSMAVAYREFLNSLLHKYYGKARQLVRSVDPHHLVSFRMSIAGDPTVGQGGMPYDFAGLAHAVDILEPEGYGRIGDWDRVKPGWFTAAYARCVAPDLPVMWAEFGCSIWDRGRMRPNPDALRFQGRFLDDFYRMVYLSGADGSVVWWFPGGYRWNERSDYGILNPDRTWRPATRTIARWAPKLLAPRKRPEPNAWLEFDRRDYADGIRGIYRDLEKQFFGMIDAHRFPGLRERRR
ncbi:MAG: hypothetical protein GXP31_12235 [Kiritimatiellaeota bacterium]|nr:hypothetical protein [Kiritimatiellota bacterium]